jgi:DNA-binding transcriptional LysR family regulator
MDINLIKTFLEVHRTRHFGRAAENLFLTQSAVSARVRLLEEGLGVTLFERKRKDMQLTAAGGRFLKHAEQLLQAWNRACQETAHVEYAEEFLTVGGLPALWDALLADWLVRLNRQKPRLSLIVEADGTESLARRTLDGELDVMLLFDSPRMENLAIQEICRLPLVLVAARPVVSCAQALDRDYVMVDWGASFNALHERYFPGLSLPTLRLGMVRTALDYILTCNGAAYLPKPLVADAVAAERLFAVPGAPEIAQPIVALYAYANRRLALMEEVLTLFAV